MTHPVQLESMPTAPPSTPEPLEQAWFEAPRSRRPTSSPPPAPTEKLGDFLGDPLADRWLR
jgi:hypothetical protein